MTRQEIVDHATRIVAELTGHPEGGEAAIVIAPIRLHGILQLAMCTAAAVPWGPHHAVRQDLRRGHSRIVAAADAAERRKK